MIKVLCLLLNFKDNIPVSAGNLQDMIRKYLRPPIGHVLLYPGFTPGVNVLEASDLTKTEIECRSKIPEIVSFLKEHVPGYKNCYMIATSSVIGVRETRHFKELITLTEKDIEQARIFDDWIVTKTYFDFDVHGISGPGLDPAGAQNSFSQKNTYTIPLGCFIPEKIDGLFLAVNFIAMIDAIKEYYRTITECFT